MAASWNIDHYLAGLSDIILQNADHQGVSPENFSRHNSFRPGRFLAKRSKVAETSLLLEL
jgi:hypothetical protein